MRKVPRIIFFGTPDFAVSSLEKILDHGYPVPAVVTAPDKPAGRGMKLKSSAVKEFALQHEIPVLQPVNLRDPAFHQQLRTFNPDLQVVVAFRMLPKEVWEMALLGTFNLHASLLPQYRGAAPINWALINGEKETGVTTFFIRESVDTGNIIFSERTAIGDHETAGELHDRLKVIGAELVVKTIGTLESGRLSGTSQETLLDPSIPLNKAPKIYREDCGINWNTSIDSIYNLVRGLSPHPGAHTILRDKNSEPVPLKVFRADPEPMHTTMAPGEVLTNGKSYMKIAALDGFLSLKEIQVTGHRVMAIADFLNGFGRYFL
jgi:methionyl-tRNA formyltransferase